MRQQSSVSGTELSTGWPPGDSPGNGGARQRRIDRAAESYPLFVLSSRDHAGRGIGSVLVRHAAADAQASGSEVLRVDTPATLPFPEPTPRDEFILLRPWRPTDADAVGRAGSDAATVGFESRIRARPMKPGHG